MTATLTPPPEGCLSDLRLDQLIDAQLDAAAERETRDHIASCDRCSERLAELEADADKFERAYDASPPSWLQDLAAAPSAERRTDNVVSLDERRRARTWKGGAIAALAAAAAVTVFVQVDRSSGDVSGKLPAEGHGVPWTGVKGGSFLVPLLRTEQGSRELADSDEVRAGDRLRFSFHVPSAGFIAVFGRDATGEVWSYAKDAEGMYPARPGDVVLPGAVELDATVGDERLFGFFCGGETELSTLRAWVVANAEGASPPAGCRVDALTLHKVANER